MSVSPQPGSRDATPATQVSLLGVPAGDIVIRSVRGTRSGLHRGRLEPYSQGDGASFVPASPFLAGERVTVRADVRVGAAVRAFSDTFAIGTADQLSATPEAVHPGSPAQTQTFVSRPDLHPPLVSVTSAGAAAAGGDIFVAPYSGPGQAGPMILDASGALVWFHPLARGLSATNFRVQQYGGAPVLTWWQGTITVHGFGLGSDVIADSSYTPVARVSAGNGLQSDLHDFQLTDRGTALLTAYEPLRCDLSAVGGPAEGAVTDGVLQEVDVRSGLVRMQWTSLDHVALAESYERPGGSPAWPYDYFHINSLDAAPDGSLLVSARNTWTVYDIDARTGAVRWRLGGRRSTFSEPAQLRTAWQHDPRVLADGSISIFDNGSSPTVHAQSRAIVLRLEGGARNATLVTQLTHSPGLVAESQGNAQQLADGDWFVGWGQVPDFSEFDPSGTLLFDAHLPAHDQSYRSFREPWSGRPRHAPALALVSSPGGATADASWNGATGVSAWRLLAGPAGGVLSPVAQTPRSGFETAIPFAGGPGQLAVQALDATGAVLGTSARIAAG